MSTLRCEFIRRASDHLTFLLLSQVCRDAGSCRLCPHFLCTLPRLLSLAGGHQSARLWLFDTMATGFENNTLTCKSILVYRKVKTGSIFTCTYAWVPAYCTLIQVSMLTMVKGIALSLHLSLSYYFKHYMLVRFLHVAPLKPCKINWKPQQQVLNTNLMSVSRGQTSAWCLTTSWVELVVGWSMKEKAAAKNRGQNQCAMWVFAKCKRASFFHMWKHQHYSRFEPLTII